MHFNNFKLVILLIYLEQKKKMLVIEFINFVICDKHVCHYSKNFVWSWTESKIHLQGWNARMNIN
jgi:hypothetical protein